VTTFCHTIPSQSQEGYQVIDQCAILKWDGAGGFAKLPPLPIGTGFIFAFGFPSYFDTF
jgi:hypothetical protein